MGRGGQRGRDGHTHTRCGHRSTAGCDGEAASEATSYPQRFQRLPWAQRRRNAKDCLLQSHLQVRNHLLLKGCLQPASQPASRHGGRARQWAGQAALHE